MAVIVLNRVKKLKDLTRKHESSNDEILEQLSARVHLQINNRTGVPQFNLKANVVV
jgi:hypothetical protein